MSEEKRERDNAPMDDNEIMDYVMDTMPSRPDNEVERLREIAKEHDAFDKAERSQLDAAYQKHRPSQELMRESMRKWREGLHDASHPQRKAMSADMSLPEIIDGDGDGFIYDGTGNERPADPAAQEEIRRRVDRLETKVKQAEKKIEQAAVEVEEQGEKVQQEFPEGARPEIVDNDFSNMTNSELVMKYYERFNDDSGWDDEFAAMRKEVKERFGETNNWILLERLDLDSDSVVADFENAQDSTKGRAGLPESIIFPSDVDPEMYDEWKQLKEEKAASDEIARGLDLTLFEHGTKEYDEAREKKDELLEKARANKRRRGVLLDESLDKTRSHVESMLEPVTDDMSDFEKGAALKRNAELLEASYSSYNLFPEEGGNRRDDLVDEVSSAVRNMYRVHNRRLHEFLESSEEGAQEFFGFDTGKRGDAEALIGDTEYLTDRVARLESEIASADHAEKPSKQVELDQVKERLYKIKDYASKDLSDADEDEVDRLFTYDESKASVEFSDYSENLNDGKSGEILSEQFGLTEEQAATIVGAPDSATVTIQVNPGSNGYGSLEIEVEDDRIEKMQRTISVDPEGELRVTHDSFTKSDDAERGFSTKVLMRAIPAMIEAGVPSIRTQAAGSGDGESGASGSYTGYYNWARHGFDGFLSESHMKKVKDFAPKARTIIDLMTTPDGRDYWRKNGAGYTAIFDLKEGSRSLDILKRYALESVRKGKIERFGDE